MPSLPPAPFILDALQYTVLPGLLSAAAVLAVFLLVGGNRYAALGSALAFAAAMGIGNWYRPSIPWKPEGPAWPWHWLPWAGLLALGVGLLTRVPRVPRLVRWLARAATACFSAWLLVPADLREEASWPMAAFAAVVFVEWSMTEYLCKSSPGGGVPLGLAFTFFAGAAVLIHAHTARLTDVATYLGSSLAGIAAVSWWRRADAGAAVPGVAVILPGLLLAGQNETFSDVPVYSFLLVALAPLALAPTLLPPLRRLHGIRLRLLQFTLLIAPLIVAVVLAMRAESLEFE